MNAPNNMRAKQYDRSKHEHYVEPRWVDDLIFDSGMIDPAAKVWDPSCGFGTIIASAQRAGREAVGTDLVNRGSPLQSARLDFFRAKYLDWASAIEHDPHVPVAIVSNPPFNLALEWAIRALDLDIGPVALIVPLRFLAGLTRAHLYREFVPEFEAVFSDRPSMPPGDKIEELGDAAFSGGTADFACVIWNAERTGPTRSVKLYREESFDGVAGRYRSARARVAAWQNEGRDQ